MTSKVSYEELLEQHYEKIKSLRNVSAPIQYDSNLPYSFFVFSDGNFLKYRFIIEQAEAISHDFLHEIIRLLINAFEKSSLRIIKGTPIISLLDLNVNTIYYFKKFGFPTEKDWFYIQNIENKFHVNEVVLVSLVDKDASSYSLNHASENKDISLREFFVIFFNEDEYEAFAENEKILSAKVKEYLGYSIVKTLTPHALYGFKRYITSYIRSKEFNDLVQNSNRKGGIGDISAKAIQKNFFEREYYKAIIGKSLFAESIVTAEWMFNELVSANSVDLTIIALGFFKALEQMLFIYIKLHAGEDKQIRRLNIPELHKKPEKIYLSEDSIKKQWINTMLDSLITFFEDYSELFIEDADEVTRKHIIKMLYEIKKLRNGYFHKNNISDWKTVKNARETTYLAIYYLLGSLKFRESDKQLFSIPLLPKSDSEKLCEYINYHNHNAYYIGYPKPEYLAVIQNDMRPTYNQYGEPSFKGLYVNRLVGMKIDSFIFPIESLLRIKTEKIELDLSDTTLVIFEGTLKPVSEGLFFSGPITKIYENGHFLIQGNDEITEY